ncbi:thioredoxin family protein [Bacillus marasmi]|uniref:thioredoxin family protein n=1 Tax=Bacillus marasmi TaxID=1926279 RepID=UPI0011C842D2|nr:thioredoxin family protein [Bacillus marasmi]
MVIKILGTGCKNCIILGENTEAALKELGMEAEIVKVTEIQDIMAYGIMSTPGLVIDEKVVSFGKVLKPKDIVRIFEKENLV